MTKLQESAVEAIKRAALNLYGFPEKKEVKQFEVKEIAPRPGKVPSLFVTIEVGYIGDEGTMQALLCRHRGNFTVGRLGGITSTESWSTGKHGFREKARKYPLIYGFTTFGSGR